MLDCIKCGIEQSFIYANPNKIHLYILRNWIVFCFVFFAFLIPTKWFNIRKTHQILQILLSQTCSIHKNQTLKKFEIHYVFEKQDKREREKKSRAYFCLSNNIFSSELLENSVLIGLNSTSDRSFGSHFPQVPKHSTGNTNRSGRWNRRHRPW